MQPYYGAYAPPGGQLPPPQGAYGGQQFYGQPPPHHQQHGYYAGAPPQQQAYGGPPPPTYGYGDDRYGARPPAYERDRGRGAPPNKGRGRSRSPSQDRGGGGYRKHGGGERRFESRQSAGPSVVLPPLKAGEVTFSLLVPAYGVSTQTSVLKDLEKTHSVSISVQEDAQGGSATRKSLRFIGTWENVRQAQKKFMELLKQLARNDLALSDDTLILIPRDKTPNLTQPLADIQTKSNTQIEVFPARGGSDADLALVVVTSKSTSDQEKSKNSSDAIAKIKEALDMKLLPSDLPSEGSEETWCKVYIPVASRFAGSIIGKSASIVRELEAETSARINLSREGTKVETPTEVFRFVTAEGSPSQVRAAHGRILAQIEEARNKARDEAKDGTLMKVPLSVPDQLIGVIIGRNGKVLRDLQQDTDTRIHIEHSGKDDRTTASVRLVEICGEPNKVEKAQTIIVERLMQAVQDPPPSQSHLPADTTSRANRSRSRSPSQRVSRQPVPADGNEESDDLDTMVIAVPIAQAGAVIGSRGDTVRQICEESGARIHIEERDKLAADAKDRAVTITGSSSQVAKAFTLIQKALADSAEREARKAHREVDRFPRGSTQSSYGRPPQPTQAYDSYGPPPIAPGPPPHSYGVPPGYSQLPAPATASVGYGQNYYAPPHSLSQPPSTPFFGNYPPRSGVPVQLPSLPPIPPPSQPQTNSQFDLGILTQLAKNLAPVGSGVITQITGSPVAPDRPPHGQQGDYRGGSGY